MAGFSVSAADRCLAILELLADEPDGVALTALSATLELPQSAVHRLLAILVQRGYARQDEATGRYLPTLAIAAIGLRLLSTLNIPNVCNPPSSAWPSAPANSSASRPVEGGPPALDRQGPGLPLQPPIRPHPGPRRAAPRDLHGQGLARDPAGRRGRAPGRGTRLRRRPHRPQRHPGRGHAPHRAQGHPRPRLRPGLRGGRARRLGHRHGHPRRRPARRPPGAAISVAGPASPLGGAARRLRPHAARGRPGALRLWPIRGYQASEGTTRVA